MLGAIDEQVTPEQRKSNEAIEKVMQTYCDAAKGKEKTMVRPSTSCAPRRRAPTAAPRRLHLGGLAEGPAR